MTEKSAPSSKRPTLPAPKAAVRVEVAAPVPSAGADGLETYQDATRYLAERVDFERMRASRLTTDLFKLDRMRALLDQLDNPHETLRCVHIAGTKGKGSTCEMTASCLEACGYAVGIYTSPHLLDVRERIRINRRMISYADFTRHLARAAGAAAKIEAKHGPATFFEHLTAMAFMHFAQEAVDIAVIEVGLGGRLDSTNVITPDVAAVTSISLDHTQLLGDTVELIAKEKAGIYKPGVPALTISQEAPIVGTLREAAAAAGAPFWVVGGEGEDGVEFSARFEAVGSGRPLARVCLNTSRVTYEHLTVPLKGEHQAMNCGLALGILDRLVERGFQCPEAKVMKGLEKTELAGRMELASASPRIYLDGAHNEASIECLVKALGANVTYDSMVVVFGCCADKDVAGMLRQLALGADKVIFTKSANTPRAAKPEDLARRFNELSSGKMCQTAESLPEAIAMATKGVGRDDLICVTGSFYLVGEAKKMLGGRKGGG